MLYARWERLLGQRPSSFLRLGSWIGGDRDGNPHVTADSLRLALGRAAQAVLGDYLEQLNALGAELSISSELADGRPRPCASWRGAAATSIRRARMSPIGARSPACYARLAATYQKLTGRAPPRPATVAGEAYPDAESCARIWTPRALA